MSFARPSKRFVSPDIAEGTTTILWPALCHFATRLATFWMRSTEPIEVPPYLCTMSAIVVLNKRKNRAGALLAMLFVRLMGSDEARRPHARVCSGDSGRLDVFWG